MTAIEQIPGIGPYLPWVPVVVMIASILASAMPAPTATSSVAYVIAYNIVHTVAINLGNAKAAPAAQDTKPPGA